MKITEITSVLRDSKKPTIIRCDAALFKRLLKFACEEKATEQELHAIVEKACELSAGGVTMRMSEYDELVGKGIDVDKRSQPAANFPPAGEISTEVNN